MSVPLHTRLWIVMGSVVLAGCSASHPPTSIASSTGPITSPEQIIRTTGDQNIRSAARIEPGRVLLLQRYGSSTCPGVARKIHKDGEHAVTVSVWAAYSGACATDARLFQDRITLPQGVDAGQPVKVTVEYSQGRESLVARPHGT